MRNLKKILALVLALVMSLSLMATAGAESFKDVTDDNPYKTAIDVLTELKVVKGYGDGNFQPDGQLNRAEAAVLVYRIATGDVEDKYLDNYTYMQQSKFTDLDGYTWAKGYINYCQNAGIVVGTDATHFNPGGKVTGYQLLVMLLRTLGYGKAGEFADPKGWELQTAAIAEREKITKNVTTGDFGAPAPRAMVAEILFRGLLSETVTYSALVSGGYTKGETLGMREFKLEEVVGVITANEYADLESSSTLDADKTRFAALDSDNVYTVTNQKTTLDDIGESRLVYIQGRTKVLHMEDSGLNGKAETVDYAKDLNALKSEAGATGSGEHFVNFDKAGEKISNYKLKYFVEFKSIAGGLTGTEQAAAALKDINRAGGDTRAQLGDNDNIVVVTIAPKTAITSVDLYWMQVIFGQKDLTGTPGTAAEDGAVYVGSQSIYDISDVGNQYNNNFKYSYDSFVAEYIYDQDKTAVTSNENGNWVKVIDNDGDGTVDYVLKTIYSVAQVAGVKDDVVTLDVKNHVLKFDAMSAPGTYTDCASGSSSDKVNTLTNQPVVSEDALAKGDVVYYAVIDGNAQTWKIEPVTAKIEKVDHNTLTATTTDGAEYVQAGVHEHIEDEAYMHFVRNLSGNVNYDLFLVNGYLAAFVKTDAAGKFRLITNAWFDQLKTGGDYAVRIYDDETGKTKDIDISTNPTLFIGATEGTLNNNWFALKYFGNNNAGTDGVLNGDGKAIHTIVAAVDEENGIIVPVENSSVTGRYEHNILDLHYLKEDGKLYSAVPKMTAAQGIVYETAQSSNTRTAYNQQKNAVKYDIRALTSTVYYVVYPDDVTGEPVVWSRTEGYSKAPDISKLKGVEDIYAVGTLHDPDNNLTKDKYYLADVVVVELNAKPDEAQELIFVVDDLLRYQDVRYRRLQVIRDSGKLDEIIVDFSGYTGGYWDNADNHKKVVPGLYYIEETKNTIGDETIYRVVDQQSYTNVTKPLTADQIRNSGKIAAGQVNLVTYTGGKNYVVTRNWTTADTIGSTIKNGWANPTGHSNKVYDPDDMRTNRTAEGTYEIPDSIPLYTLSYGRSWQWDIVTLGQYTGADFETVLAKHTDSTTDARTYQVSREDTDIDAYQNRTYFNYNDVMVYYSGSTAVYAISFANLCATGADDAQNIWLSTVPSGKASTVPTVKFFDQDATTNTTALTITGSATHAQATEKNSTKDIVVTNGEVITLLKNGNRVTGDDMLDLTVESAGATYTGTILGKDGKTYTFRFDQGIPATAYHGLLASTDLTKLIVKKTGTDDKGNDTYDFNIEPTQDQTRISSLIGHLVDFSDPNANLDTSKGNGNGYVAYDQFGENIGSDPNLNAKTVKKIELYLKDANGVPYTAVINCTVSQADWTAAQGRMSTLTVKTNIASSPANNTTTVKVYSNWQYPGSPANVEVTSTDGGYTYKVPAGASLMLVVEDKDWNVTKGTWSVNAGNYNQDAHGTWKDGTIWNAVNVYANWTTFEVTFTIANAKPAAKTMADKMVDILQDSSFSVTHTSDDDSTADAAILAKIKDAVKAKLIAAGETEANATAAVALITIANAGNAGTMTGTAAGAAVIKNNFEVDVDHGATLGAAKDDISVNSVRFNHLFASETELNTAVNTALSAPAYNASTMNTIALVKADLEKKMATVKDAGTESYAPVTVTSFTVTKIAGTPAADGVLNDGDTVKVEWTVSYNGETWSGTKNLEIT